MYRAIKYELLKMYCQGINTVTQSLELVSSGIPSLVTLAAQAAVFLHTDKRNYKYTI